MFCDNIYCKHTIVYYTIYVVVILDLIDKIMYHVFSGNEKSIVFFK